MSNVFNWAAMDAYGEAYWSTGTSRGALGLLHQEALREDSARDTVRAAGKSWLTHKAKFSGAVVPR